MKKLLCIVLTGINISCFGMHQDAAASTPANEKTPLLPIFANSITFDSRCSICQEKPTPPIVVLPCGHYFCELCLNELRRKNGTNAPCPICRASISQVGGVDWSTPILPISITHPVRTPAEPLTINPRGESSTEDGRFCCSYTRFKRGCELHCPDYNDLQVCSLCNCMNFCLTGGCLCSCLDRRGRIYPSLCLAQYVCCKCTSPAEAVDDDNYLCANGTACFSEACLIPCILALAHI